MELILLQSVDGLGRPGDQVKVRSGYARNFLLPTGRAVAVSADALRGLTKLKAKAEAEEKALLSTMEELGQKIAGTQVQITARSTEDGHLFGSVTDKDIHHAFTLAGWQLPPRAVRLNAHLKEAGVTDVELHLHGNVIAAVKVEVVPVDAEGNKLEVVARVEPEETPEGDSTGGGDVPEEATNS